MVPFKDSMGGLRSWSPASTKERDQRGGLHQGLGVRVDMSHGLDS